jgi:hypothetical protein
MRFQEEHVVGLALQLQNNTETQNLHHSTGTETQKMVFIEQVVLNAQSPFNAHCGHVRCQCCRRSSRRRFSEHNFAGDAG